MKRNTLKKSRLILSLALALAPAAASAFDSGSTGALGAFNPTASTVVTLPPDGILNYTTVNVPAGVNVTFNKNVTNTPVVILASGDVTITGLISVSGTSSPHAGAAGDGNTGDDGEPGRGGPGGYDGGHGGTPASKRGGSGLGPGGGGGGSYLYAGNTVAMGGGGAGHNGKGASNWYNTNYGNTGLGGPAYGSPLLLPLIGGSGGGGGAGANNYHGSGGGGGGGALLIASSGTVTISGKISANGGSSGNTSGYESGGTGGGGSGGAVRIIANIIQGEGAIDTYYGNPGSYGYNVGDRRGGGGAWGRVRLEATTIKRTAGTNPGYTTGKPGSIFLAGLPSLRITSVAGTSAPAEPTGTADITLPATTTNPVTVQFASTGVPAGSVVKLTVTPSIGAPVVVNSPGLVGTTDNATTSVSVTLPKGPSTLMATTSYTLTLAQGEALSTYAKGERVERVELAASTGGTSMVTLVTVSGKKYTVPSKVAAMVAG